ncbi:response regulator [Thermanaerothrix sp. 4228-RoL]|uniref:Response regulator n=1 Tax=Thermanaerothrix solaris TaxID=3058434 RepID=A0ABU3NLU7_9CHLR|nr:response regulator [Thermanaerothrix sp. 4228-RoL]MDT8897806.1 response regulator [Thermanaerothrix sp. 4228-RoL]
MLADVKKVLVYSPQLEFSEYLRLSLEETGLYQVTLCDSASELAALIAQPVFDILVVDFPGGDTSLGETLEQFTRNLPDVPLLLFPPENNPHHREINAISAWAYLSKPFYLPNLLLVMETLSRGEKIFSPSPQMPKALEVLQQQLQSFVDQEDALAAWILSAGHPLAEAKHLESDLSQDVLAWAEQRWQRLLNNGEWLHYKKSTSPGGVVLLYATPITSQTLLLVAYPTILPLAQARAKGCSLATALKASPWLTSELVLAEIQSPSAEILPVEDITSLHDLHASDDDALVNILDEEAWSTLEEEEEESPPPDFSLLEQWLREAPPPNPSHAVPEERTNIQPDWLPETAIVPETSLSTTAPFDSDSEAEATWEFEAGEVEFEATEEDHTGNFEPPADFLEALAVATESLSSAPPDTMPPPIGDEIGTSTLALTVEDTQPLSLPSSVPSLEAKDLLLTYTAVLITSSPNALQNPRATTELSRWMPRWCQRLGWALKRLVITPNYLLWTVTVPSSMPPSRMVEAVRHHSAWRLFHHVGEAIAEQEPESFWAPTHLALAGESPPSNGEIDALISLNRSNPRG